MKQHERTHKGGAAGARSGSATSTTAAEGAKGAKRAAGSAGVEEEGEKMDVDADGELDGRTDDAATGSANANTSHQPRPTGGKGGRPHIKSELSEIMETIDRESGDAARLMGGIGGGMGEEADGEGESPGLDALATAASGMSG